jgi:hypothetical protein
MPYRKYIVTEVGDPSPRIVEAPSAWEAVKEVAACAFEEVCLSIWRSEPLPNGTYRKECYMPRDNSGRQWVVTMPMGEGVR